MGGVSTYPFARWPRVSRDEVVLGRRLARALPEADRLHVEASLTDLLACEVRCDLRPPRVRVGRRPPTDAIGVSRASDPDRVAAWIEIEPALGRLMVDRLLGGTGQEVPAHLPGSLPPAEAGVLAYLVARVLADVGRGRVLLAEVGCPDRSEVEGETPAFACATVAVRAGERVGRAVLWIPTSLASAWAQEDGAPPGRSLGDLGSLEVELAVDVGRGRLPAQALVSWRRGDVFVPDELWDDDPRQTPHRARGRLLGASRTTWWLHCDAEGVRLLRLDRSLAPPIHRGEIMTDTTRATLSLVGDAPVEIAVELARVRLPLEELVALQPGEILTTGQLVGDTVTLRAGDRAVAVGELVEVDGTVGVRLVRTLTHPESQHRDR